MRNIRYLRNKRFHCDDFRRIDVHGYTGFCHPEFHDFLQNNFPQFIVNTADRHSRRKQKRSKFLHWKLPFTILDIDELTCKVFETGDVVKNLIGSLSRSKAEASFIAACHLLNSGLDTPLPFAWLKRKGFCLQERSIIITERIKDFRKVKRIVRNETTDADMRQAIISAVADYATRMHDSGIIHCDLNLANFLLSETDHDDRLVLIDLNRCRYSHRLSAFLRMKDIGRLYWKHYEQDFLELYCDENNNLQRFIPFVRFYQRWRKIRRRLLNYFRS